MNDNVMELLIMVDALRRASAGSITAVIPYYGYARQDRKVAPRTPITSKLVADLIQPPGVNRVVSVDLHAGQIQGFFNIPFDHLYAMPVDARGLPQEELRLVGGVRLAGRRRRRAHARILEAPRGSLAIIDKRRERANVSEVMNLIGEVKGKDCIIIDDIIDTAGTLCGAARALADKGARRVVACATHGVLSGPAVQRIAESPMTEVVVTRLDPAVRRGEGLPEDQAALDRAPARRGHQAHPQLGQRQLALRLTASCRRGAAVLLTKRVPHRTPEARAFAGGRGIGERHDRRRRCPC